tara:strand:- start:1584 stop:2552 length:969 start_codon:yes stop_codon:yes gene_type:complete
MTEVASHDPLGTAMEQSPGSDPAPSNGEGSPAGSDLFELDLAPGESREPAGQPEAAETPGEGETPPATETQAAETPETPEERDGRLRQEDYSRKTQTLARDREAHETRVADFERRQSEFLDLQRQAMQSQQGQQPNGQGTLSERIRATAAQTQDPDERNGYLFMADLTEMVETQRQTIEAQQKRLDEYGPHIYEASQASQRMTQEQNEQWKAGIRTQAVAARKVFSAEEMEQHEDFVTTNLVQGGINRATDKPYTVSELMSMATGKPIQEAQEAIEENRAAATGAKRGAAPPAPTPSPGPQGGPLTREQAVAEIRRTGRGLT